VLASLSALVAWALGGAPVEAADQVAKLMETLAGSTSFKIRLQAAAVLAKLKDPRVAGAIARTATQDPSPLVRAFAARLLGKNPGGDVTAERARIGVARALRDPDPRVRTAAAAAMAELTRSQPRAAAAGSAEVAATPSALRGAAARRITVAVRDMGDVTGRAPALLKQRMRAAMLTRLGREPGVNVSAPEAPDVSYVVDGAIRKIDFTNRGEDVETLCAVELIVSRPPRGIVLVAQGEAAVQRPRRLFKPEQRSGLEAEALEHAVQSAHENLAHFLASASAGAP
jgi:hypothetical protein